MGGSTIVQQVSLLDVFPTVMEEMRNTGESTNSETSGKATETTDGTNLRMIAVLRSRPKNNLFLESDNTAFGGREKMFGMVKDGRWKFILNPEGSVEMYDLREDKGEMFDISSMSPGMRKTLEEFLLDQFGPRIRGNDG
jgi:arylsulfatase A-like enzyme